MTVQLPRGGREVQRRYARTAAARRHINNAMQSRCSLRLIDSFFKYNASKTF